MTTLARFSALVFLWVFSITFISDTAHAAYILVNYGAQPKADGSTSIDPTKRTHVLISSKGNDLGMGPQLSVLTKAAKIVETYPADQIVLFIPEEAKGNLGWLKSERGANQADVQFMKATLEPKELFTQLERFSKIASLHTYGHGAIIEGPFLDRYPGTSRDVRWYPSSKEPQRLVGHFTADAYVTLNGCNLGHSMAPMLSSLWQIPVSGALTGSEFEVLMPNGRFAPMNAESNWAKDSGSIYGKGSSCARGCVRMRPATVIYNGHYGKYRQGLSFFKFFCAEGVSEASCLKGMARALMSDVTASFVHADLNREHFAAAAREWLCPVSSNPSTQMNCEAQLKQVDTNLQSSVGLTESDRRYTPFRGASHQCDFGGCYENKKCLIVSKTSDCAQRENPPVRSTTFVDEYVSYMKGFDLLKAESKQSRPTEVVGQ